MTTLNEPGQPVGIFCGVKDQPVWHAVADLCRDLGWVTGQSGRIAAAAVARILIEVDASIPGQEGYRIETVGQNVRIVGSDTLGVVFGIYAFSEQVLGVDPFWYWKDLAPTKRQTIDLPREPIIGAAPAFRWRGWFLNDEDLLTKFQDGGGQRNLDYPFYQQVTHPDLIDLACETLLRTGGNLIIPASFLDVMNPAEARLIEVAVARGLFVSQHHIEPLGVSAMGYETFWLTRGQPRQMRYSDEPEVVRETWRQYAQRWWELAGDRVIWQLGLRGRGDRPVWIDDKKITAQEAGRYISQAMADQMTIVREVDTRPAPPVTTTLFLEGAELMAAGELTIPAGVTIVFSDHGYSQKMQRDFHECAREAGRGHGVYFHIAFWIHGPHLAAGQSPQRAVAELAEVAGKGDTQYAIINVSNIREHIFGIDAAMLTMRDPQSVDLDAFWLRHLPRELVNLAQRYFDAVAPTDDGRLFQDGDGVSVANGCLRAGGGAAKTTKAITPDKLAAAADALEALSRDAAASNWPEGIKNFCVAQFVAAPLILACSYRVAIAAMAGDPAAAAGHIEKMLTQRQVGAVGRFANWYRGDDKANWPGKAVAFARLAKEKEKEKAGAGDVTEGSP